MKNEPQLLPTVIERPIQYLAYPPSAPAENDAEPTVPLSHYLWILRLQRWKILGFIAACVVVTTMVSYRLVPIY